MMRSLLVVLGFALPLVLNLAGCGTYGDDSGDCPDLSGAWAITAHSCQPSEVGRTMTFTQSGCVINQVNPWPDWNGSINAEGDMIWSGPAGEETMVCNAVLSGDTITASCNPPCEVTAVRQ